MPVTYSVGLPVLMSLPSNDHPTLTVGALHRDLYDYDFDELCEDVRLNGINKPLRVVNGVLVDGHHRAIIAKELGLTCVPVEYSGTLDKLPH
jgi:ParB-like chromosome segregation protein Spo0J